MNSNPTPDTETARALLWRHGVPEDVIDGALCLHGQELAAVQRREAAVWGVDTAAGKRILGAADLIDPTRAAAPAVPCVSAVDQTTRDRIADRGTKAEALLLHFTAEAHRRKWNYDRGLDDDGQPIKSEAFGALHRLGDEMNAALHKLRATPAAVLPPPADRADVLREEAARIRAHCPDHLDSNSADGAWISCHCDVADDMERRLADEAQQPAAGARQPDTETPYPATAAAAAPCSAVALRKAHVPHHWKPQPGMDYVLCPGASGWEHPSAAVSAVPGRSAATSTDEEQARG